MMLGAFRALIETNETNIATHDETDTTTNMLQQTL